MAERPLPAAQVSAPERSITAGTIIAFLLLVIIALGAWFWSDIMLLVFGAILLAVALRGGANRLHSLVGLNVKIGVLVVVLAVLGALAGVGRLAGPAIAEQLDELITSIPESWEALTGWIAGNSTAEALQDSIEENVDLGSNAAEMAQRLPQLLGAISGAVNATVGGVMSIFLLLIMALYLAMEAERYRAGAICLLPIRHRSRGADILDEMGRKLRMWLGGQALDMLAVGVMAGVGLWLLDVPLAFILALIAALTNIIPIIGPFISGAIAVLFAFTQGIDIAVQVLILFIVIQLIDGEIILPLIQRFAVSLPPALTVVGIMAFGALFGLAGILLATPLLVVLIVLIQRAYIEDVLGDDLGQDPEKG
ncbi:MAG: AI-2E family transporter [Paracoccus sp. (in: a-proteobacteria)]|nr:AI-2E family transporter [Paracoccus sp. (in: a-proteobacteria)]